MKRTLNTKQKFFLSFIAIQFILLTQFALGLDSSKIVIIGSGLAGLTTAYELESKGITTDIYEASDRSGGRVQTNQVSLEPLMTVEEGGTYIDSSHRAIRALCRKFKVPMVYLLGQERKEKRFQFFNQQLTDQNSNFDQFEPTLRKIENDRKKIKHERKWYARKRLTPTEQEIEKVSASQYLKQKGACPLFMNLLESILRNEYGADLEQVSALIIFKGLSYNLKKRIFNLDGKLGDEGYVIKGGGQQLIKKLVKHHKRPIHYNHILRKVSLVPNSNHKKNLYQLTFETPNGIYIRSAEKVVLAISSAAIRNNIQLDLPISNGLRQKINELPYGKNQKFFLFFDKNFWKKKTKGARLNFLTENYWIWSNGDKAQNHHLYGITVFLGGSSVEKYSNKNPEDFAQEVLTQLESVFPNARKHFVKGQPSINWAQEEFIQGSYAGYYPPAKSYILSNLTTPNQEDLYFAGAQWEIYHQGYMNGAIISGQKTALKILKNTKIKKR